MAPISELNQVLSDVLTVPLATVKVFSRLLRENRLLSQKGHGRGAANATPLDAARSIIALMTTSSPANAVKCVQDFGQLNAHAINMPDNVDPIEVKKLGFSIGHRFESGLSILLAGLADPKFATFIQRHSNQLLGGPTDNPDMSVSVVDTLLLADIKVPGINLVYSYGRLLQAKPPDRVVPEEINNTLDALRPHDKGIRSTRTIAALPLLEVSKLVNGKSMSDVLRKLPVGEFW